MNSLIVDIKGQKIQKYGRIPPHPRCNPVCLVSAHLGPCFLSRLGRVSRPSRAPVPHVAPLSTPQAMAHGSGPGCCHGPHCHPMSSCL